MEARDLDPPAVTSTPGENGPASGPQVTAPVPAYLPPRTPPPPPGERPVHIDRKVLVAGAVLVGLFFAGVLLFHRSEAPAAASRVPGELVLVAGQSVRKMVDPATWVTLSPPVAVKGDSLLMTGRERASVLKTRNGGTLRLDRNSQLKIASVRDGEESQEVRLDLHRGRVWVQGAPGDRIIVLTRFARVEPVEDAGRAVYLVAQLEKEDLSELTRVSVWNGSVRLTHADDPDARVLVAAGYTSHAAASQVETPKPTGSALEKQPWIRWNLSWEDPGEMPRQAAARTRARRTLRGPVRPPSPAPVQPPPSERTPPGPAAVPGEGRPAPGPQPPPGGARPEPRPHPAPGEAGPPPAPSEPVTGPPSAPVRPEPPMPPELPENPAPPPVPEPPMPDIPEVEVGPSPDMPPLPPGGGPGTGASGTATGDSGSSGDGGFAPSYPTPAPTSTQPPPGYAPGSDPVGPSGPVYRGYP